MRFFANVTLYCWVGRTADAVPPYMRHCLSGTIGVHSVLPAKIGVCTCWTVCGISMIAVNRIFTA